MDTSTGLTILATAIGSANIIEKILGPTADYIGNNLKEWTERRVKNVSRIFQIASDKLGSRIDSVGSVPPKVLKGILEEGSFCEDEISAEYFGGVLASSRSENIRNDIGAGFIALLAQLTTYQIRTHYIFYHTFRQIYNGMDLFVGDFNNRSQMKTFIPYDDYDRSMDFSEKENPNNILDHSIWGLNREELISSWCHGEKEYLEKDYNVSNSGIIVAPSAYGVELFLWVHGRGDLGLEDFLKCELQFTAEINIDVSNCHKVITKYNANVNK